MILGKRIEERLDAKGWSQAELARRIGVQSTSIWKLVVGQSQSSKHLHRIARELDTSVDYLIGEVDEPTSPHIGNRRVAYGATPTEQNDLVEVAEINLTYGMGATILDGFVDSTPRSFSRAWLRNFTDSPPDQLFWARGQGNSMEPEIRDGDIVLIDRRQRSLVMADLIWAFAYGDTGMIKWLRPMPDGSVEIHSSNQSIRSGKAYDGEISLIGRVVAVVKRL